MQKYNTNKKYTASRKQSENKTFTNYNTKQEKSLHPAEKKKTPNGIKKCEKICRYFGKCGGCDYCDVSYSDQLKIKQMRIDNLMSRYCKVSPIVKAENPLHYRHKVHAVFGEKNRKILAGTYKKYTHDIIDIDECKIEDKTCDAIIRTIKELIPSFKIRIYNEDTDVGLLRHVLVRKGKNTGDIMVVLVTSGPVFPSKNNFAKVLRERHPEITTIVQNINDKQTSMVLGSRSVSIYGKGYIEDVLCGKRFRISPESFYQVNPEMTELLYRKAIDYANLTGKETVIDAYCGTGTIGIIARSGAKNVIGVELNKDAVKDAIRNAKLNDVDNIQFFNDDAGQFMVAMAENGQKADVVIMDPPRSGSDEAFLSSVVNLSPKRVVYISCGPDSLARDTKYLVKHGYSVKECTPFDCFPYTEHIETIALFEKK